MTQKKAEILLATVIAARATSLLFSKIAMNGMGIFNLLAARFLMAFVLLAVVFFKRLRHIKRHTLVRGAIMGGLFFLMLSTELTGLKSTPSSTVSLLENTAIILVPMAEAVLRHKLPKAATAVSALVAIGGVATADRPVRRLHPRVWCWRSWPPCCTPQPSSPPTASPTRTIP